MKRCDWCRRPGVLRTAELELDPIPATPSNVWRRQLCTGCRQRLYEVIEGLEQSRGVLGMMNELILRGQK